MIPTDGAAAKCRAGHWLVSAPAPESETAPQPVTRECRVCGCNNNKRCYMSRGERYGACVWTALDLCSLCEEDDDGN